MEGWPAGDFIRAEVKVAKQPTREELWIGFTSKGPGEFRQSSRSGARETQADTWNLQEGQSRVGGCGEKLFLIASKSLAYCSAFHSETTGCFLSEIVGDSKTTSDDLDEFYVYGYHLFGRQGFLYTCKPLRHAFHMLE
jgi:hypothetical protein